MSRPLAKTEANGIIYKYMTSFPRVVLRFPTEISWLQSGFEPGQNSSWSRNGSLKIVNGGIDAQPSRGRLVKVLGSILPIFKI